MNLNLPGRVLIALTLLHATVHSVGAHPGHSMMDAAAGGMHSGHELEFFLWLVGAVLVTLLPVTAARLKK